MISNLQALLCHRSFLQRGWYFTSMSFINSILRAYLMKIKYRKANKHNSTSLCRESVIQPENVIVGRGTYGSILVRSFDASLKLRIGNYCSIGPKVEFLLGIDHPLSLISTFPFKAKILDCGMGSDSISKGDIVIDDDVWIGQGSSILSGVHIYQGAVVAAGALVTKNVPPYSVVGGVPAKIIKYRFNDEMISSLLRVDYSRLTKEEIAEHVEDLYTELKGPEQLEWLPKKEKAD